MELVYLWVEKYKNIIEQGFDFSPRFECKYKDGNLTICDKEKKESKDNEYLENFFGDKINVTAIVGENGSGKSNILEMLFTNNIIDDCKFFYVVEVQVGNNKTRNIIAYKFDDTMSIYSKELKLGKTYKLSDFNNEEKSIDKFSTLFYSTSSYTDNMSNQDSNIQNAENLAISEKETYLSYKLKSIEYAISMIKNNAKFEKLFDLPEKIIIGVKEYKKPEFCKEFKPSDKFIDKIKIAIICEIYEKRQEEVNEKDIDYKLGLETVFNKIIEMSVIGSEVEENINKFIEEAEKMDGKYDRGIRINIDDIKDTFVNKYQKMVNYELNSEIDLNILNFSWYPHLSTGQETYLFQFANFYNAMKKDDEIHNNCIILVDEGECTLHPNWQKKYINYLSSFLKDNFSEKNIHLILSSHSPFILSDLPKENVIFLKKDKETGDCENVTKETNIETFGANIHTLLSHGFFMSDGLMGEFAKSKINEAIDNLHGKSQSLSQKQIKSIIDSIGEPFLQIKLEQMYKEKFGLDDEIEELEKRQEEINLKIEQLKKQKTENAKS